MKRIILLESDPFFASILIHRLRDASFEVEHAMHGEEGWRLLEENPPDVLLLDIVLPRKDGFQILEAKQSHPTLARVPTFILTKLATPEDIARCFALGIKEYFIKTHHSLDQVVKRVGEEMPL